MITPLEPRRLFTTYGADESFGAVNALAPAESFGDAMLAVTGAVYVEAVPGDNAAHVVARLKENGAPDTAWADGGRVVVPFDVERIVYDKWHDKLILAGVATRAGTEGESLELMRLNADGTPDESFGVAGRAHYTPGDGAAGQTVDVENLFALRRGGVMVALRVQIESSSTGSDPDFGQSSSYGGHGAVALVRFKPNGNRDAAFANRGRRDIAASTFSGGSDEGDSYGYDDSVVLEQLRPRADGGVDAVLRHEDRYDSTFNGPAGRRAVDVITRSFDAAGGLTSEKQWKIFATAWDDETLENRGAYTTLGLFPAGEAHARIVGRDDDGRLQRFDLAPDKKPVERPIALPDDFVAGSLVVNPRGGYFAVGTPTGFSGDDVVLKLRADFSIDRAWGLGGAVRLTAAGQGTVVVPDAEGRLLLVTDETITRFDGSPVRLNQTPASTRAFAGDALHVLGTSGDDVITVTGDQATDEMNIAINDTPVTRWPFSPLLVDAGGGADRVTISGMTFPVTLLGGRGADRVTFAGSLSPENRVYLGPGADTFAFGRSIVPLALVAGGPGRDTVTGYEPGPTVFTDVEVLAPATTIP